MATMAETLDSIFARIGHFGPDVGHNDKGSTHSYIEAYARLLAPYREKGRLLEIGLALGESIRLWSEYMGADAEIIGMDISVVFDPTQFDSRVTIIEADATDPASVYKLPPIHFDVIIDDGSHMEADQLAAFGIFSKLVRPGGIYVIEDILNFDLSGPLLTQLKADCEVIDLRSIKGRFDDMLLVYHF